MKTLIYFLFIFLSITITSIAQKVKYIPVLDSEGWKITGPAVLQNFPGRQVDVVDHSFVKRSDGKWMVWAAIRNAVPNHPIYGWVSDKLTNKNWKDIGIVAVADSAFGEDTKNGLYAPHFKKIGDKYYCYYTSNGMRVMQSNDGVNYARMKDKKGNYAFIEKLIGRDVMIFDEEEKYYAFSAVTTFTREGWHHGFIINTFAKFQTDPFDWPYPEYSIVNEGGQAGNGHVSAESPFVVKLKGYYYLFRASSMTFKTYVYRSDNLFDFGVNTDQKLVAVLPLKAPELIEENGQWYISDLDDFRGLKMYKLRWDKE